MPATSISAPATRSSIGLAGVWRMILKLERRLISAAAGRDKSTLLLLYLFYH